MLKYAGRLIYGKIVVPETLTYKRETALATEPFSPNGLCREHQEAFSNASRGIRQRLKRHSPLLVMGIYASGTLKRRKMCGSATHNRATGIAPLQAGKEELAKLE